MATKRKVAHEFDVEIDGTTHHVTVYRGKGKHARNAQRVAAQDPSLFNSSLLHQLVELDGKKLTIEDWDEVDIVLYMTVFPYVVGGKPSPIPEAA